MAYFSTCFNCAADKITCSRRTEIRDAILGFGITSIKFRCPDRQARFKPGQRVEFNWTVYNEEDAYYGCDGSFLVQFVGTVIHEKKGNKRFVIRIDPNQECEEMKPSDVFKNSDFISVRPDDMTAIDEPDRQVCVQCAAYDKDDAIGRCYASGPWQGSHVPIGCLAHSTEQ